MRSCILASTQFLLGGCRSIVFTESDRHHVQTVEVGTVFSVSLSSGGDWSNPKLQGSTLEFLSHRYDLPAGPHVFEFRAERAGETAIRIPVREGMGSSEEFILRVKVVRPMMPFVAR